MVNRKKSVQYNDERENYPIEQRMTVNLTLVAHFKLIKIFKRTRADVWINCDFDLQTSKTQNSFSSTFDVIIVLLTSIAIRLAPLQLHEPSQLRLYNHPLPLHPHHLYGKMFRPPVGVPSVISVWWRELVPPSRVCPNGVRHYSQQRSTNSDRDQHLREERNKQTNRDDKASGCRSESMILPIDIDECVLDTDIFLWPMSLHWDSWCLLLLSS